MDKNRYTQERLQKDEAFSEAMEVLFTRYPLVQSNMPQPQLFDTITASRVSFLRRAKAGGFSPTPDKHFWCNILRENCIDWQVPPDEAIAIYEMIYG